MSDPILTLAELVSLVQDAWTARYERGRILHVHQNAVRTASGSLVHLRVLVQQIAEADAPQYNQEDI